MRKYLLAATAAAVISTPAFAAANGPYVGIEGGVTFPQSTDLDVILNNTSATPATTTSYSNGYNLDWKKPGWNIDAVAGYKLGLFKLEVEGGYQRAKLKSANASSTLLTDVSTASGTTATVSDLGIGSKMGVKYLTANALIDGDFGGGFGGYAGAGYGRAWASYGGDKDNAAAVTGIAGLRYALSSNVDAGLKYQYLHTGKLNFSDAFAVNGTNFTTSAKGNYDSHSVLASLVYNFNSREAAPAPIPAAAPAPPPPPPPAAPATQTCPDGSVILATSTCPAPPPPPPPPAPAQRGERGR
jgi:opacity protein-like surface antigen